MACVRVEHANVGRYNVEGLDGLSKIGTRRGGQLDCNSYALMVLLTRQELPGVRAAFKAALVPIIIL